MRSRIAAPQSLSPLSADSRCLFHADAADMDLDAETGELVAITEHRGTFTRGGNTLASVTDSEGNFYTAMHAQPAWESRVWAVLGDLEPQPALGIKMGTNDRLAYPVQFPWQPHRGLHLMIETGARATDEATVLSIANAALTGPAMWIEAETLFYSMSAYDGTTTITATLTTGQPVSGDRVTFDWRLDEDGRLHFAQTIGGHAVPNRATSAGVITFPATVDAGLAVRINSRGATANPGSQWWRKTKLIAGNPAPNILAGLR